MRYITTETLTGRQHFIKEYSIAVNVLNRPDDFSTQDDAIVRIHAGRLRRTLDEYYATEGRHNAVFICIPKGCYIPEFSYKDKTLQRDSPVTDTDVTPVIAIFPFRSNVRQQSLELFSTMLCEELSAELSRFEDISVIGHFSTETIARIGQNILEAAQSVGADFILTGSLHAGNEKVQLRVNLLNSATGEFLMTRSFEHPDAETILRIQQDVVHDIAGALGGYYGLIFKEIIKKHPAGIADNFSTWKGIYSYYKYQRSCSPENYLSALTHLSESARVHPNHAVTWAMLGELHLDGIALALESAENSLEEGYRCVMKALNIDPHCQHAWHALAWANLFKRDAEGCLQAAEQCIQLNPYASGIVSGVGCMLIFAGFPDKGFPIMEHAIQTNPHYPWWINIGYVYYYLGKKDYTNALYRADKMESEETFWGPLLKAAALSFLNEDEKAKKQLSRLLQAAPETPEKIDSMLSSHLLADTLTESIIASLVRIGLVLAPSRFLRIPGGRIEKKKRVSALTLHTRF